MIGESNFTRMRNPNITEQIQYYKSNKNIIKNSNNDFQFPICSSTITEITGESGLGKTNLLIYLSFLFAKRFCKEKSEYSVIYISTKKFPNERLESIINFNTENQVKRTNILNKINVVECLCIEDYEIFINKIEHEVNQNSYKVLIVDDLASLADKIKDVNHENTHLDIDRSYSDHEENDDSENINVLIDNEKKNKIVEKSRYSFITEQLNTLKILTKNYDTFSYVVNNVSAIIFNSYCQLGNYVYDKFKYKPKLGEKWCLKIDSRFLLWKKDIKDNIEDVSSGVKISKTKRRFIETIFSNYSLKAIQEFQILESGIKIIN